MPKAEVGVLCLRQKFKFALPPIIKNVHLRIMKLADSAKGKLNVEY